MSAPADSPFGRHDYELVFSGHERAASMTISGKRAPPPTIGDIYTLGRPGGDLEDMVVMQLTCEGEAWIARCEIADRSAA